MDELSAVVPAPYAMMLFCSAFCVLQYCPTLGVKGVPVDEETTLLFESVCVPTTSPLAVE
jgi:hypothetical protein